MCAANRAYAHPADFTRVSDFLIRHFLPGNADGNWLQPAWEYMHHHPNLDRSALDRNRIWEDGGEIAAVAHYESQPGEAFFQLHPTYTGLKPELLDYAESCLAGVDEHGQRYLHAYLNDFDADFEAQAVQRGYQLQEQFNRPLYSFDIPQPFPPVELPEGFCLKSLADDNDLWQMHRVLWRGFDNPGEPPPEGLEWRMIMQSGPNFRPDLTIVVAAPDGNFAAFCGMWHETAHHIAYVEPVATDPDYRRMGLGRAAVLEGIRRCAAEGATQAFVGSDQAFYRSLGFQKVFVSRCWAKTWR